MLLVILRTDGFFIVCDAGERRSQPEGEEPSHVPESFPFFQYAARGGNDRQGGNGILQDRPSIFFVRLADFSWLPILYLSSAGYGFKVVVTP